MKTYFLSYSKKRQYLLLFCDTLVLAMAVFISYAIRVYINQKNPTFNAIVSRLNPWQVTVIGIHLFTLYLLDQYNLNQLINKVRSSIMLILSILLESLTLILMVIKRYNQWHLLFLAQICVWSPGIIDSPCDGFNLYGLVETGVCQTGDR